MTKFTEHLRRRVVVAQQRLWAMVLMLLCLSLSLMALYYALNIVVVSDTNGNRQMLVTHHDDPDFLMREAGILPNEGDNVFFTSYNGNIANVSIERAYPIGVKADGKVYETMLCSGTVEDVLSACGVTLTEHDYTQPSLSTPVYEGIEPITVHRVIYNDTVIKEDIPFDTQYEYTSLYTRNRNKSVVLAQGKVGIRETTSRERVVDGIMESSKVIKIEDTALPQNQIIKKYQAGAPVSKLTAPPGITVEGGKPSTYRAVFTGRATGYSSKGGRGASGLGLYEGTVAVNPAVIPYGSTLYITSTDGKFVYGWAIATDTGTALQTGHALVDLYYETYEDSLLNAVRQVNVYVVK